jgi:alanine racemase
MESSPHVSVHVDLARIRANAEAIAQRTGVELIAVVKADAYGLGADAVAAAIGDVVDAFYVFSTAEVVAGRLREIAERRIITLMAESEDPEFYISRDIRPVVWTAERAKALKKARPILSVDTGQQRFACPLDQLDTVREAGDCDEIMTHATTLPQVHALVEAVCGGDATERQRRGIRLHAAGSALLDKSEAWLDAVRPGLALYEGATRVTTQLVDVRQGGKRPAGYTGFSAPHFGLILAGYAHGLRSGPCLVDGHARRILEVGMQSSFVEIGRSDRVGDEVTLLGGELTPQSVADEWKTTPHEALLHLASLGRRMYR